MTSHRISAGLDQTASCHEMIRRLPNGYETAIGEDGIYLSGD
jgi:ABC-type protease/lipase transport system fused ATPase/permease subunit